MRIDGNEKADKLAELGSNLEQTAGNPHDTAKITIYRHLREEAPIRRGMDDNLSRKQQLKISRLRFSRHPELRYWRQKTGKCETEQCRGCEEGPETFEHIMLNCPVPDDVRQKQPDWSDTSKNPNIALNLWNTWIGRADPD